LAGLVLLGFVALTGCEGEDVDDTADQESALRRGAKRGFHGVPPAPSPAPDAGGGTADCNVCTKANQC
jgi:hypothetical protein